ncbi:MAG: cytidylate kinase-like family protein [Firmicutes bacterium]|nr:cytidylate kinase-like family protein [Bacillota bacterium]
MKNVVFTIGRQYGSGGRLIGEKLAKELGIPFYDKELLTLAAKESGFCEEIFETHDEKPTSSFLYSLVMGGYGSDSMPLNHKLFLAQFETIKKVAKQGPCVILGRCADYALEEMPNVVNVFIHADIKERAKRAVEEYGEDPKTVESIINKTDKKRASYYNYYSDKKWGAMDTYNLSIDSGKIGIDNAVKLIKEFAEMIEE